MMRVFIDENMPRQLAGLLDRFEVSNVEMQGWKGIRNGNLLRLVSQTHDVLVTADASIEAQNDLSSIDLSLVVLPTNDLTILRAGAMSIVQSISDLEALGEAVVMRIDWRGQRVLRRTGDGSNNAPFELQPIPPFGFRRDKDPS